MVQAYILIQTEVGKAATVAEADRRHLGRDSRRGRDRPLRRHRPRRGLQRRRPRSPRHRQAPGRPGHHADPHLHGRPRLRPAPDRTHVLHDGGADRRRRRAVRVQRAHPRSPSRPQASAPVCASVAWPADVSGHPRVATQPDDRSVAAWGDPAIIARCGLDPLGPDDATTASPSTASTGSCAAHRRVGCHDLRPRPRHRGPRAGRPTARCRCSCPPSRLSRGRPQRPPLLLTASRPESPGL